MKLSTTLACAALTLSAGVSALQKVTRAGRYLYTEDGNRFYIKGVAYQEQGTQAANTDGFPEPSNFIDPAVDSVKCRRDVALLQQLSVNAVRLYSVDPTLNHDDCMSVFSQAGIYTIVDLSQPVNGSLDRAAPRWSTNLLNLYLQTVDAFIKYDNVLAFTVGNEVVTSPAETVAAPFIKAAARDVKAYLKSKGSSALVTYASTDGPDWRILLANFLSCGSDAESLDLYGLNNYEWKGNSSIAAYSNTNTEFANFNIPAYFSEFGAPQQPRLFTEVQALFGTQMSPIWSGGLAFSYFPSIQEGFGLVDVSADGSQVTPNADFTALQTQYTAVQFVNSPSMAAAGTTAFPACAPPDGVNFLGSDTLPPTPNQAACDCAVQKAFACDFKPQTTNVTAIIGQLLDTACSLLGQANSDSCSAFDSFGNNGTYGLFASCDPASQLSFAMSAFYELNGRNPASCNFAGNATINTNAPSSAAAASAAATSCLSSATGTFTPTGPAVPAGTNTGGASSSSNSPGSTSGSGNAASRAMADLKVAFIVSSGVTLAMALGAWSVAA